MSEQSDDDRRHNDRRSNDRRKEPRPMAEESWFGAMGADGDTEIQVDTDPDAGFGPRSVDPGQRSAAGSAADDDRRQQSREGEQCALMQT